MVSDGHQCIIVELCVVGVTRALKTGGGSENNILGLILHIGSTHGFMTFSFKGKMLLFLVFVHVYIPEKPFLLCFPCNEM